MTAKRRLYLSAKRVMLTCLLLTVGALAFLFLQPVTAQAASESDLSFYLNHDGQSYTAGSCKKTATGDLVIPATYNGLPVTEIGLSAFYKCTGLTGITIPEGITVIEQGTFRDCTALESITLPDSVEIIYQSAFSNCTSLKSITLSKNLTRIDEWAFWGCSNLESITIPEGVTEIGWQVFEGCPKLTHISLPSSLVSINENPFADSPNLMYNIYDNGKYLGNADNPYLVLMESTAKDITQCQIHTDTKLIHCGAFADCTKLTQITVPDNVTTISSYAFQGCTSLTDLTIGKSVSTFHSFIVSGCTKLKGIWVAEDNPNFSSNDLGILFNKDKTTLIKAPLTLKGEYTIPETVVSLYHYAFSECDDLTGITVGKNITEIGYYVFSDCSRLTGIWVAEDNPNYKTDSAGALLSKDGTILFQVPCGIRGAYTVPETVTQIFPNSFYNCTGLESIILPESVRTLGHAAFDGCTGLKTVYFTGEQEAWKKLAITDYNAPPETTEIVFGLPGETTPATSPTTEPTTAPSTDPTNPADKEQNKGNLDGVIIAVIAVVAIGVGVFVNFKKTA